MIWCLSLQLLSLHEGLLCSIYLQIDRENKWLGTIPAIRFQDKSTYTESDTKKYDMVSFASQ